MVVVNEKNFLEIFEKYQNCYFRTYNSTVQITLINKLHWFQFFSRVNNECKRKEIGLSTDFCYRTPDFIEEGRPWISLLKLKRFAIKKHMC